MLAHVVEHGVFAIAGSGHRRVPTLAGERNLASDGGNQSGHAEPGVWSEHADWGTGDSRAATYRLTLLRRKVRQGQRQGGKVVDHLEAGQTEPRPQSGDRKGPGMVSH